MKIEDKKLSIKQTRERERKDRQRDRKGRKEGRKEGGREGRKKIEIEGILFLTKG